MAKDYFKELYEAKKELLRCYTWMSALSQKMGSFPIEEIDKSKYDIEKDIEAMEVDIKDGKERNI